MKIEFYISEKVLLGYVSCAYCFQRPFTNYEDVKFHFDYDCLKICVSEKCDCNRCYLYGHWRVKDLVNVHVNQKNALLYYTEGPKEFWACSKPQIIVREWNGCWKFLDLSTIDAA